MAMRSLDVRLAMRRQHDVFLADLGNLTGDAALSTLSIFIENIFCKISLLRIKKLPIGS